MIADGGQSLASVNWVDLLVHENVHAIQDARFDLGQLSAAHATDLDRGLAFGSVFEGDATYVGDLADAGFFGTSAHDMPWQSVFERWQRAALDDARSSSRPVTLSWSQFRYPFGTAFVKAANDAQGWAGVDALFAAPPESAREVVAGFGAAEPTGGPWAQDLGDDAVPVVGDGYDYVDTDRMGAWIFAVFLQRIGNPYQTRELPPVLRGDALSIFQDRNTGGAVAVWRLRLASSSSSFWLRDALSALPAARLEELNGGDVAIVAATDVPTLSALPFTGLYQAIPPASSSAPPPANWECALPAR